MLALLCFALRCRPVALLWVRRTNKTGTPTDDIKQICFLQFMEECADVLVSRC